jgi:hypothetical protein
MQIKLQVQQLSQRDGHQRSQIPFQQQLTLNNAVMSDLATYKRVLSKKKPPRNRAQHNKHGFQKT